MNVKNGPHWGPSYVRQLFPLKNENEIKYYAELCIKYNLSKRDLGKRIKSNEYERLPIETRDKLTFDDELNVKDLVPNPILIRNKNNIEVVSEKILHSLILEDIESFMKELGTGFCFVVVELKITELRKEYIGQIEVYMNYVDLNLKKDFQDKTIGIIICKKDNKYVIRYFSDDRIMSRVYEFI